MQIVKIKNPFDRNEREIICTEVKNSTISVLIEKFFPELNLDDFAISVNGGIVTDLSVELKDSDYLVLAPKIQGGGGKQIGALVGMIALAMLAPGVGLAAGNIAGGTAAGATATSIAELGLFSKIVAYSAMMAFSVAGGQLINGLVGSQDKSSGIDNNNQAYSWNPETTQQAGVIRPECYGEYLLKGNVIMSGTDPVKDSSEQKLNTIIGLCNGPIKSISNVRINDLELTEFEDVSVEYRYGFTTQDKFENFDRAVVQTAEAEKIESDNPLNINVRYDTNYLNFEIDFFSQNGLFVYKDDGTKRSGFHVATVEYKIDESEDSEVIALQPDYQPVLPDYRTFEILKIQEIAGDVVLTIKNKSTRGEELNSNSNNYKFVAMYDKYVRWRPERIKIDNLPDGILAPETLADFIDIKKMEYLLKSTLKGVKIYDESIMIVHLDATSLLPNKDVSKLDVTGTITDPTFYWEDIIASNWKATTTTWDWTYYIDGTLPDNTLFDFRLKKLNDTIKDGQGNPNTKWSQDFYYNAFRNIRKFDASYPRLAAVGIKSLASEELSGSITFSCTVEGKYVQVYDDVAETWSIEYSNNPAWVVYDILTCPVYTGSTYATLEVNRYDGVRPEQLDLDSFVEFADFCDNGGDPLHTFNGYFASETNVWEAAIKVLEACRATIVPSGQKYKVVVDKAGTPVQLFSMGNIVEGSYSEAYLPATDRADVIEANFFDADQDYQKCTLVASENENEDTFSNKVSIELFGKTNSEEVWTEAFYRLRKNKYLTKAVSFKASCDAIACESGDLIYFQHDETLGGQGGRVLSSTSNSVTVDNALDFYDVTSATISNNGSGFVRLTSVGNFTDAEIGNTVYCNFSATYTDNTYTITAVDDDYIDIDLSFSLSSPTASVSIYPRKIAIRFNNLYEGTTEAYDKVEIFSVDYVDDDTVYITTTFTDNPVVNDLYAYGIESTYQEVLRVIAVDMDSDQMVTILANDYHTEVYSETETPAIPSSPVPSQNTGLAPVTNLAAKVSQVIDTNGSTTQRVELSWLMPTGYVMLNSVRIYARASGVSSWELVGNTTGSYFNWNNPLPNTAYTIKVVSVGFDGRTYSFTGSPSVNITTNAVASDDVDNIVDTSLPITDLQVSGLILTNFVENNIFATRNAKFSWYALGTVGVDDTVGNIPGGFEWDDSTLENYHVVIEDTLGNVIREEYQWDTNYTYTYENNYEDNSGEPLRDFIIKVAGYDIFGNYSKYARLRVINPVPDYVANLSGYGGMNSVNLMWDIITDADIAGYKVWGSTSTGFTPDDETNLLYQGPNNFYALDTSDTYYFKVAAYDSFGSITSELNISGQYEITPETTTVDFNLPLLQDIDFTPYATTGIEWSAGSILYNNTIYPITQWHTAEANVAVLITAGVPSLVGVTEATIDVVKDRWLVATNFGGVVYPCFQSPIIHGALVQAETLTADKCVTNYTWAKNFIIESSGAIYTDGKDSYSSTTDGIFLGWDTDAYKLNVGDDTSYLKWDGSAVDIKCDKGLIGNTETYYDIDNGIFYTSYDFGGIQRDTTISSGKITLNYDTYVLPDYPLETEIRGDRILVTDTNNSLTVLQTGMGNTTLHGDDVYYFISGSWSLSGEPLYKTYLVSTYLAGDINGGSETDDTNLFQVLQHNGQDAPPAWGGRAITAWGSVKATYVSDPGEELIITDSDLGSVSVSCVKGSTTGYYTLTINSGSGNWIVTPSIESAGTATLIINRAVDSNGFFDNGTTDNIFIEARQATNANAAWSFIAIRVS